MLFFKNCKNKFVKKAIPTFSTKIQDLHPNQTATFKKKLFTPHPLGTNIPSSNISSQQLRNASGLANLIWQDPRVPWTWQSCPCSSTCPCPGVKVKHDRLWFPSREILPETPSLCPPWTTRQCNPLSVDPRRPLTAAVAWCDDRKQSVEDETFQKHPLSTLEWADQSRLGACCGVLRYLISKTNIACCVPARRVGEIYAPAEASDIILARARRIVVNFWFGFLRTFYGVGGMAKILIASWAGFKVFGFNPSPN